MISILNQDIAIKQLLRTTPARTPKPSRSKAHLNNDQIFAFSHTVAKPGFAGRSNRQGRDNWPCYHWWAWRHDQFELEVKEAVAHASALRDNIPAECVGLHEGGGGVVAKICFADGVCWADKMFANSMAYKNVYYANKAMAYARQYCPAIPIPEPKAWYRNKIHHYVTGWVEGNQRWDRTLSLNWLIARYSPDPTRDPPRTSSRSV